MSMIEDFKDPIERSKFGLFSRINKGKVALVGAGVELAGVIASVAADNAAPLVATTAVGAIVGLEAIENLHNNRNAPAESLNVAARWMVKPDEETAKY